MEKGKNMKKVIFSQILAKNGVTNFSGLFNENGLPVNVELEVNEDGVVLTAIRRKLSDVELMEICNSVNGCESCVFQGDCDDEGGEI